MTESAAIRVLHVVGGMNRSGVETWLMHLLRHVDRGRFAMDFLVHTSTECPFDREIRALGSSVIPCLHPSEPRTYARTLRRILADRGPYDVVHSHVHHFSGFVLRVAAQTGIPVRIAHSHNDTTSVNARPDVRRRVYLRLMRCWIARYATAGFAVSRQAAIALFGHHWERDPRRQVLRYALDLDAFRCPTDRAAMTAALGVPPDAFVVGHVGRFDPQKNHAFLVDVAAEIARLEPRTRLVLVGDGPLHAAVRSRVRDAGLEDHVRFLGVRNDVAKLMTAAFDVFLFPSLYEGLGIVLVEAQAAGLPCVLTSSLPSESVVVPALVTRLSLNAPPSVWAREVLAARHRVVDRARALALVEQSPFNIERGLATLENVYLGSRGSHPVAAIPLTQGAIPWADAQAAR